MLVDEHKLLSELSARLDRPVPRLLGTRWPLTLLWIIHVVFFMLIFQIAQGYNVNSVALALGSLVLGLATALLGYASTWARQWPIVRQHIDRASLRSRLNELEA